MSRSTFSIGSLVYPPDEDIWNGKQKNNNDVIGNYSYPAVHLCSYL